MKASIVIVTRNAGPDFESVLAGIARQELEEAAELIVIDSDSRDSTRDLATRYGAHVHRIPASEFNHGATRNLGIEMSQGEMVALLTQDALPHNEQWLAELLAPFSDPRVAGVYSRVVPRPNATPLVKRSVEADLVYGSRPMIRTIKDVEAWLRQSADHRRTEAHFNNVSSCVRRSVMQKMPFPAISFGEDLAWANQMLQRGAAIAYQPTSIVEHSHESRLRTDFERHLADARLLKIVFGLIPGPLQTARTFGGEVLRDLKTLESCTLHERVRHGCYSPWLRGAQALGRLVGTHLSKTEFERTALDHWAGAP